MTIPELETVRIGVDGEIATLRLNRPESLNATSPHMLWELSVAAQWLADRGQGEGIRALVVTGEGRAFSAGGDVTTFLEGIEDPATDMELTVRRGADVLHSAIVDFRRIPFPVVAAVNGAAAGAGFSLALMCDVRLASDRAVFVVAYDMIGASPDGGMTYFLPRLLGPARALELMLTRPTLSAEQAKDEGLVAEVVPHDELLRRANELAGQLAAKSPHFVRHAKDLVAQSFDNSLADHLNLEARAIAAGLASEDARNAVKAFFAGEQPTFEGR